MKHASPSGSLVAIVFLVTLSSASVGAMAAEHVVRIVTDYEALRMAFEPEILEIEPGDRVTWINEADEEHDVVLFPDGYPQGAEPFRSPILTRAGERFSHRFTVSGTYEYHCLPHLPMGMQGLIIVEHASTEDEFHQPSASDIDAYRNLLLEWFDEDDIATLEGQSRLRDGKVDLATDRDGGHH